MSGHTPKKRRLETGQGPLKDTVRSTVVSDNEQAWTGKELVLIQLPANVNISRLDDKEIDLNEDHTLSLDCNDGGKSSKRRDFEVCTRSLDERSTQFSILVPSNKPGRLKPGPPLSKCIRLTQSVEVPAVELPPVREEEETKVEMPTGLKQRWKPFGYRKPTVEETEKTKTKHKVKKKSKKAET